MDIRGTIRRLILRSGDSGEQVTIDVLRSRLVSIIVAIGVVAIPLSLPTTAMGLIRNDLQPILVVNLAVWLYLLYVLFVRKERSRITYYSVVAVAYLASLSYMVALGPSYARGGWLVAVVVIAAFLLGSRASLIMTAINAATLAGLYLVMLVIDPGWHSGHGVTGPVWAMFVVNISALSIACGLPVGYLLAGLDRALGEERIVRLRLQKTLEALENEVKAREKLEAELVRSHKLEAVGRFASGIAHDLNNIFLPVMAHAEMAERSLDRPDKARSHLEQVLQASNQAKEMVSQILAFGRQSKGKRKLVDPRDLVQNFLTRLDVPDRIHLQTEMAQDDALVLANQTELLQVLMNLTVNAIGAMEPDGGSLTLSLGLDDEGPCGTDDRPDGGWYRLEISDTGCGMDEQTAARAFDPFFTTKELGKGTGLGLAIVHGIVTGHGGRIDLRTSPRQGTTFAIYLPVASGQREAA